MRGGLERKAPVISRIGFSSAAMRVRTDRESTLQLAWCRGRPVMRVDPLAMARVWRRDGRLAVTRPSVRERKHS
jgi:hypothetical protein